MSRCQQDAAYEAEHIARAEVPSRGISVTDAEVEAGRLVDEWKKLHPGVARVRGVEVHEAKAQRKEGVALLTEDLGHIEVPGPVVTVQTLCHEVAHLLTPGNGHGAAWARAYLELVYVAEGPERYVALSQAFTQKGVMH